jgi:ribonucleoside-diphosphate reductase alpha chain
VPPVGSGAILAGTSSGIEPIFALKYRRRSKSLSGGTFDVHHPLAVQRRKNLGGDGKVPDAFVTAHEIDPSFRVQLQGKIQRHVDSSISSTVNLSETATEDDVEQIFLQAWRAGCKGITVYREGSREGILLSEQPRK